jgi:hypothetical protein
MLRAQSGQPGGGSSPSSDTANALVRASRRVVNVRCFGYRLGIVTPVSQRLDGSDAALWARVRQISGCWEWEGAHGVDGDGALRWDGRTERAYRVAWIVTRGEIPDRHRVRQTCANRACCRPDRLGLRVPVGDDPAARAGEARRRNRTTVQGRGHLEQRGPDHWRLVVYRGRPPVDRQATRRTPAVPWHRGGGAGPRCAVDRRARRCRLRARTTQAHGGRRARLVV